MGATQLYVPVIEAGENIRLHFFSHIFVIAIKEDMLFLNGERLKTTKTEYDCIKPWTKEGNQGIPKRRIKTLKFGSYVLGLDVGHDGRIFFKVWLSRDYKTWRAPPFWTASYWHNRGEKKKLWYEQNLHTPAKVWGYGGATV